jgi:hypothetical protein
LTKDFQKAFSAVRSSNLQDNGVFPYNAIDFKEKENLKKRRLTEEEINAPGILGRDALRWVRSSGRFEGPYCFFFRNIGNCSPNGRASQSIKV